MLGYQNSKLIFLINQSITQSINQLVPGYGLSSVPGRYRVIYNIDENLKK